MVPSCSAAGAEPTSRLANGRRQPELLEEDRVHLIRVVLSRVDDGQRRLPPHQRVHHGGDLDELRSRADDECDHVPTCLPGWPAPARRSVRGRGSAPARAPASSSLRRAASRLALCISAGELSAALAHLAPAGWGGGQRHLHRVRQPPDIAGRDQPPVDVVLHQLGDPRDPGGDDRPVHGEGLHDDDRQPLGEAGHHQRAGLEQQRAHPLVVDPARHAHGLFQPEALDLGVDLPAQRTVAGQDDLDRDAAVDEEPGGAHHQKLPLLLAEPSHAEQPWPVGDLSGLRFEVRRFERAADHVDLQPVGQHRPAIELAATERRDHADEGRALHLLAEREPQGAVELVGTVDREAVAGAAEPAAEHHHRGRVGAEVRVDVPQAARRPATS